MAKKLENCFYGRRQVVYVQIQQPTHRGEPQKHLSVYGQSLERVIKVVDGALAKAFGKTGVGRPPGRPRKKK